MTRDRILEGAQYNYWPPHCAICRHATAQEMPYCNLLKIAVKRVGVCKFFADYTIIETEVKDEKL